MVRLEEETAKVCRRLQLVVRFCIAELRISERQIRRRGPDGKYVVNGPPERERGPVELSVHSVQCSGHLYPDVVSPRGAEPEPSLLVQ